MLRINLLLLLAIIGSAFWLINLQYQSRKLVSEMHRAEGEARRIEIERERLTAEKRAQASPSRVERIAREQLQMRMPTPAITQYVQHGGKADAATAQGANGVAGAPGTSSTSGTSGTKAGAATGAAP